jgi:excisionase family DNA binding protein
MDEMLPERKTVSIPRACELVGVSRRTIYNWLAGGKVQYVRTAGGSVRIFEDTLWRDPAAPARGEQASTWAQQPRLSRGA